MSPADELSLSDHLDEVAASTSYPITLAARTASRAAGELWGAVADADYDPRLIQAARDAARAADTAWAVSRALHADYSEAARAARKRGGDSCDDAIHHRAMAMAEAWASTAPEDRVQSAMAAYKAHGGGK